MRINVDIRTNEEERGGEMELFRRAFSFYTNTLS